MKLLPGGKEKEKFERSLSGLCGCGVVHSKMHFRIKVGPDKLDCIRQTVGSPNVVDRNLM